MAKLDSNSTRNTRSAHHILSDCPLAQVGKLKNRFGVSQVALVRDRSVNTI
jgi:hypothetical protein